MSDKAASQKTRSPEGCDENGPAAALLLGHVSIQICSLVAPCRRPILIATPLHQSLTWCTRNDALDYRPAARLLYRRLIHMLSGTDQLHETKEREIFRTVTNQRVEPMQ